MRRPLLKDALRRLGLLRAARSLRALFLALLDRLARLIKRCLGPRPVFDRARVKSVLAIRLDRVGDVILTTPALRAIKETYPRCHLTVLVRRYTRDLLAGLPFIDELLCVEDFSRQGLIAYLRQQHFDVSLGFHPDIFVNLIAWQARASFRVGYAYGGGGLFLTHALTDDREQRVRHEVTSALEVAAVIEARAADTSLAISVLPESEAFAASFFHQNGLSGSRVVVIHPGSRQPYIRWQREKFAQVADRLFHELQLKPLILAGPGEEALVRDVVGCMKAPAVMASGLPLKHLAALIKRCSLFIGNSTGPMHVAAALKVPVVAIFGSRHPLDSSAAWGPWGQGHAVVAGESCCRECHPGDCSSFECLEMVSVDRVLDAAQECLKTAGRDR
jgi:heptosyltransferase-2